jgi:hypothetical protein
MSGQPAGRAGNRRGVDFDWHGQGCGENLSQGLQGAAEQNKSMPLPGAPQHLLVGGGAVAEQHDSHERQQDA